MSLLFALISTAESLCVVEFSFKDSGNFRNCNENNYKEIVPCDSISAGKDTRIE